MKTELKRRAPGASLGIDLTKPGAKAKLADAPKRRDRAALVDEVRAEQDRLVRRIAWLSRKVERLPLNSNGRRAARAEGLRLVALGGLLGDALNGKNAGKIRPESARNWYEVRAIRLLNDLAA